MQTRVRSRAVVEIRPDLRQLRIAAGWDVREAAILLHQNAPLLYQQEIEGQWGDPEFREECSRQYVSILLERATSKQLPSATDAKGVPRIQILLIALGIDRTDARKIFGSNCALLDAYETGSSPMPIEVFGILWYQCLDWAHRRRLRLDTRRQVIARAAGRIRRPVAGFSREELATIADLASTGRLTGRAAELEVLRLLGVNPDQRRAT
jgi:hypothetical protein